MVRKSKESKNPTLIKPRQEVSDFLKTRIEIGKTILSKEIRSTADFDNVYKEKSKWHKFNVEYLRHCFDVEKIAEEYDFSGATSLYINATFSQDVESLRLSLQLLISELESIDERLSVFTVQVNPDSKPTNEISSHKDKVFIVHGHNEALKHQIARFINKFGLKEIILNEQPNVGMTVIEKFEQHAQSAGYAIVLLTNDDIGYPKDAPEQARPRARQNAIAELGYFMKALGRKNIAILSSEEIEIPSDFNGVIYLSIKNSNWELDLAKEMRAVGLSIDLNLL